MAILIVGAFTVTSDLAKAAGNSVYYQPSEDVMDLSPAEVANVASKVASYTPMVEVDPVIVALAMKDSDFLAAPVITSTQVTAPVAPAVPAKRSGTITYTVQDGDTLSSIGWKYGLKIATIKASNSLSGDTIRPGQQIKLPPQDLDPKTLASLQVKKVAGIVRSNPGSKNNAYPYGWCTYYVATRRYVPGHWGNARSWLDSARSAGYTTGSEPAVGAIVVTSESWMGHVAYVEKVSGGSITISEMNYRAWGVVDQRTLSAHGGVVRGYIY